MSLRSVCRKNMINELRGGLTAFASGSNFGYPSSITSRNDPEHVRRLRRLRDHDADQHHRLVYVERPELAQSADLQRRRHADVEPGAHTVTAGGNLLVSNASSSSQQMVRGDHARVQHGLRPGGRYVHHRQLPGRVERAADAARATYAVLTGRVAR